MHTFREGNQVADCLANMAHDLDLGIHHLDVPPSCCSSLILFDCMGVSHPRTTLV